MASKLAPTRRVVVGSPAYFSSRGMPQSPEELVDHDCLVIQNCPASSWHFVKVDREARAYQVSGRVTSDSAEALLASALAGVGLAHLPTWLVHEQIQSGHLVAVLRNFDGGESVHGGIYAVRPASRTPSAKVRALVQLLRKRFGQPPFWDQVHETPLQEVAVGHLRLGVT
jgi:LysR family transcriptional regulator, pyoluteorin biosynthesis regulator